MFKRLGNWLEARKSSSDNSSQSDVSTDSRSHTNSSCALRNWSELNIDGHHVELFDPGNGVEPDGCVLFLHGHGRIRLASNDVYSRLFQQHNLAVICPDGKRSWWMDRVCGEFDEHVTPRKWLLESVVPMIETRWNIVPPRIALLGISMGGQGALQLAYCQASRFPIVAAISPTVDFDQLYGAGLPLDQMYKDREEARQDTVVLNLHPLAWPRHQFFCCDPADREWFDGCARLGMKLSSSGILHERDLNTSAGGHTWDYFNSMAPATIQHIVSSLRKVD